MTYGYIHSIVSPGTVDGPGVRAVAFFQGCPLRCAYCHNPDTWRAGGGEKVTARELVKRVLRFRSYFGARGGVTASGGEPLLQAEFVAEFFRLLKKESIHTALDTSGCQGDGGIDINVNTPVPLTLKHTDLVILDIKHTGPTQYNKLTGGDLQNTLDFLESARGAGCQILIRQVIIPGINDTPEQVLNLKKIADGIKIELKPYHTLGISKWQKLGIDYLLKAVPPCSEEKIRELREIVK